MAKPNWCDFFQKIEEDPKQKVQLTIGAYLLAAEHIRNCDECLLRTDRVLAKDPNKDRAQQMWGTN